VGTYGVLRVRGGRESGGGLWPVTGSEEFGVQKEEIEDIERFLYKNKQLIENFGKNKS
jgi:hypothetical protein